MENFARLFILHMDLQEPLLSDHENKHDPQEKWREVDRFVALYSSPALINHVWTPHAHEEYDPDPEWCSEFPP